MTTKRKPVVKPAPILVAVDEMYWRARVVTEFLEGYTEQLSIHAKEAVAKLVAAIDVYEVSRGSAGDGVLLRTQTLPLVKPTIVKEEK